MQSEGGLDFYDMRTDDGNDDGAKAPMATAGASEAPKPTDAPPAKRPRGEDRDRDRDRTHALVSCFDAPTDLQEVELQRLRDVNCRLYCHIAYDPSDGTVVVAGSQRKERRYWRAGMTRKMLQTFVRSLTVGYLSRSEGVSLEEAYSTFEYENVHLGVPNDRAHQVRGIKHPPAGVAYPKRQERLREEVTRLCEEVAHAITLWPRLEGALDAALRGGSAALGTASPTRAWVRFVPKPTIAAEGRDPLVELASKQPKWLVYTLNCIGAVFYELVARGDIDGSARDEPSYTLLAHELENRTDGNHFLSKWDVPRHLQSDGQRRKWASAARWAAEVRLLVATQAAVTAATPTNANTPSVRAHFRPDAQRQTKHQYACAVVGLAEQMMLQSAAPSSCFCSLTDSDQATWERELLGRALKERGIEVVQWTTHPPTRMSPLRFPPHWCDSTAASIEGEVSVLLDFALRR